MDPFFLAAVLVSMFYVVLTPFNKVEESFNTQALHDFLYHGTNLSQYDHHEFPGVVPRTFLGSAVLSLAVYPLRIAIDISGIELSKLFVYCFARALLSYAVIKSYFDFINSIQFGRTLPKMSPLFAKMLVICQFHFLFYSSRLLPNTFALLLCLKCLQLYNQNRILLYLYLSIFAVVTFRFELILLLGPLGLALLFECGKLSSVVKNGMAALIITVAITVLFDSMIWGYWVWPEGVVFYYNVIENQSHNWGTMPFLWYFYSALPRSLLMALPSAYIGFLLTKAAMLRYLFIMANLFVVLYSCLPHKELRFILYVIPIFNVFAGVFLGKLWEMFAEGRRINKVNSNQWKRNLLRIAILSAVMACFVATCVFSVCAFYNYPAGFAVMRLNHVKADGKALRIHIDDYSAQTGVSRFLQAHGHWTYDKSSNVTIEEAGERFDFMVVSVDEADRHVEGKNFFPVDNLPGFAGLEPTHSFPFIRVIVVDRVMTLANYNGPQDFIRHYVRNNKIAMPVLSSHDAESA